MILSPTTPLLCLFLQIRYYCATYTQLIICTIGNYSMSFDVVTAIDNCHQIDG